MSSLLANHSLKLELTVYGYLREYCNQQNIIIPTDLNSIILAFYQKSYKLIGIGHDSSGEFGSKKPVNINGNKSNKWVYLTEFTEQFQHPQFISTTNENFFICNNNEYMPLEITNILH